jgi:hypothetical protein
MSANVVIVGGLVRVSELDAIALKYATDKSSKGHYYTQYYEKLFSKIRNQRLSILEIGVYCGSSIMTWLEYFPNASIYGIDCRARENHGRNAALKSESRYEFVQIDLEDVDTLREWAKDKEFDIVIDDGSHVEHHVRNAFEILWPKTKKYYVVEDLHQSLIPDEKFDKVFSRVLSRETCGRIFNVIIEILKDFHYDGNRVYMNAPECQRLATDPPDVETVVQSTVRSIEFFPGMMVVKRDD